MKYLISLTQVFSRGGIPVFNQEFLRAVSEIKKGKQSIVLALNDKKIPAWFEKDPQMKIICCGKTRFRALNKIIFTVFFVYFNLVNKSIINIVGHIRISSLALWTKKMFKNKYIVLTHGIEVWNVNEKSKQALKNASTIVSVSNFTWSKIKNQTGLNNEKFFLLPNTIDSDFFVPAPKNKDLINRYGLKGFKTIFTLSRLAKTEKDKGIDQVIRSLPLVLEKEPNTKYLVGGKGDDVKRLKKTASELGVEDKVISTGYVPDQEEVDHFNLCDLFIMPSKKEGFGIVFLQALACGKPVIAGNKDGSVEAVLSGEIGSLVDPDNINQIANTIVSVLQSNPDSEYLRNSVINNFGLDKFNERVFKLFNRLEYEKA